MSIFNYFSGRKNFKGWEVIEKIARGGQGDVFKVGKGAEIAVLKRTKFIKEKKRTRFLREIQALKILDHPNIIKIIDDNYTEAESGKYGYMVIPYAAHGSLADHIKTFENNIGSSLKLCLKICSGLLCAHDNVPPIVHRDLRPANILFMASIEEPVISDFGVCCFSKQFDKHPGARDGAELPPGLVKGRDDDPIIQSDILLLGKLLYTMLSGGVELAGVEYLEDSFNLAKIYGDEKYERINGELFANMITGWPTERFSSVQEVIKTIEILSADFE